MDARSFGGYSYHQRLAEGPFGEVWRGLGAAGDEARILVVDHRLAGLSSFARELTRFAAQMPSLDHPHVVAMRQVGMSGDDLVVVTDAVAGGVVLEDLMQRSPGLLPRDVALGIAVGAIEGLAHAHSLGVVHGAVHPRSVVIDFHGGVKLGDFGVSWALAESASDQRDSAQVAALRGYLAPEIALGRQARVTSDVYAAGALVHTLLCGRPPPSPWPAGATGAAAIRKVLGRALAIDPGARLVNATELEELLEEAALSDGCRVAPAADVARFVSDRLASADSQLDADTADVLSALEHEGEPAGGTRPGPGAAPRRPGAGRRRGVSEVIRGLESENLRSPRPRALDESSPFIDHTDVDDAIGIGANADPLAEIYAMSTEGGLPSFDDEGDSTPLPRPTADAPGSFTRQREEFAGAPAAVGKRGRRASHVDPLAQTTPLPQITPADVEAHMRQNVQNQQTAAVAASMAHRYDRPMSVPGEDPFGPRPRRSRAFLWLALTVFALAITGAVVYTQSDDFDPGKREAAERDEARAREEAIAAHAAEQPVPVDLTVTSAEEDGAVWLLLGRTPLVSIPLSSAMVHELRLEHEGYQPVDLRVSGYDWKGEEGTQRAEVGAALQPGAPAKPPPAFPPAPATPTPGGPRGRGVVHVSSQPAGAQVWLLIGFTPRAAITGLEAGRAYEIKVLKDGFRPGFAAVAAEEWYVAGKGSPVVPSLARDVTLSKVEPEKSPRRRP
ncbi:MAG TPA: protein kinase [Kofleriaceae bacterium]|nr:protein kinase [Kofleriaceae bacterium]